MPAQFTAADAAAIVRSEQKDAYYVQRLARLTADALSAVKGTQYALRNSELVQVATKIGYLWLTLVAGQRSLGQEYVDLIMTTTGSVAGSQLASKLRKIVFVAASCIVPYVVTKLKHGRLLGQVIDKLTLLSELNLAVFYLSGKYYSLAQRITGLRYTYGHGVDANQRVEQTQRSRGYKVLGALMLLKITWGLASSGASGGSSENKSAGPASQVVYDVNSAAHGEEIDLSDSSKLKFLQQRECMLCLETMKVPTTMRCGHVGCWGCLIDWIQDHDDCPLCRGKVEGRLVVMR